MNKNTLTKRMYNQPWRQELIKKFPKCHYCECGLDIYTITRDHKVPRKVMKIRIKKGEKTLYNNIVGCCKKCNNLKGEMPYEEFLEYIKLPKEARIDNK